MASKRKAPPARTRARRATRKSSSTAAASPAAEGTPVRAYCIGKPGAQGCGFEVRMTVPAGTDAASAVRPKLGVSDSCPKCGGATRLVRNA